MAHRLLCSSKGQPTSCIPDGLAIRKFRCQCQAIVERCITGRTGAHKWIYIDRAFRPKQWLSVFKVWANIWKAPSPLCQHCLHASWFIAWRAWPAWPAWHGIYNLNYSKSSKHEQLPRLITRPITAIVLETIALILARWFAPFTCVVRKWTDGWKNFPLQQQQQEQKNCVRELAG